MRLYPDWPEWRLETRGESSRNEGERLIWHTRFDGSDYRLWLIKSGFSLGDGYLDLERRRDDPADDRWITIKESSYIPLTEAEAIATQWRRLPTLLALEKL